MAAVATTLALRSGTPAAPEMRVEITTPPTSQPASIAISPDGGSIAFVAADAGRPRLWLRSLESGVARSLPGTEGASFPFWAPHGRSIGFFADDGRLKRVDLDGGVRVLAHTPLPRGGTWNHDDVILFAPLTGPVFSVPAAGGEPVAVTKVQRGQLSHAFPRFLPGGRHFLYNVTGAPEARGIYAAALDGTGTARLADADSIAASFSSGHLLFARGGTLFAQRFDPERLALEGQAFAVTEGIGLQTLASFQVAALSASPRGHVVYRTGTTAERRQFVWFDRSGKETGKVGNPDESSPMSLAMSPDGRRLAVHRRVDDNVDIWLLEIARGGLVRFTSHGANEIGPFWSPDGSRIVFGSNRGGGYELYEKPTSGAQEETRVLPFNCAVTDWSRDGRLVLCQRRDPTSDQDIWLWSYGTDQFSPLVQTEFDDRDAQFSPDGKWIAYASVESGRWEIYVQPFPGPGARSPVSINGGAQPRWRSDGRELFFVGLDDRLMAAPISLPPAGGSPEIGEPVPLFPTRIGGAIQNVYRTQYFVSPDGSRFLMNTIVDAPVASPLTLILNWKARPPG